MAMVVDALGARRWCSPVATAHPMETVDAGAVGGRDNQIDGLIAVGGSSAVDCAKGIAVLMAPGTDTCRLDTRVLRPPRGSFRGAGGRRFPC